MKEELAQYLLKKLQKKGADDVIVELSAMEHSHLKFSNSKITTTKAWNLDGLNVFMAKNKKIVASSLKTFSKDAIKELVSNMMQSAKQLPANPNYEGIAKGPFKYKKIKELYDPKIHDMEEEFTEITKQAIDKVMEQAKRADGVMEGGHSSVYLLTSNGVEVRELDSSLYLSIRALVNKQATGHDVTVSRIKKKFDYLGTAEQAASIAKQAKMTRKSVNGTYDVIFHPHAFANLLQHVGGSASVFAVESGLSFLGDAVGKKVANDNVTIYDDGTLPNGYGSGNFDDEGHPTQRNTLIKDGFFKTYLHNTSTAARYKTKSTGNAGLVAPDPHNIVLKPGDFSKQEMFQNTKKAVYITNVWYTRFNNHVTGDFSTIPRDGAFYVENGEIKHALKNVRVSDNMIRILKNISAVGKTLYPYKTWEVDTPCYVPYVTVKDVCLSKPS